LKPDRSALTDQPEGQLPVRPAEFDQFASQYEKVMERPCAVSGESPDFYAVGRMRWCLRRLRPHFPLETALDFGCGVGGSIRYFFEILGCKSVVGVDPSVESLQIAKERHLGRNVRLSAPGEFVPSGSIPLAFCNGVFHHIPPDDRLQALRYIRAALSDNGILAFWENNPWNPLVVYSMSLNEFDRNAQTLSPLHSVHLLKAAGFRIQRVDYCFFFPHFARGLRRLEPMLRWLPLGAQYLVLAKK
jgi:SAM-dependent methyltransferase